MKRSKQPPFDLGPAFDAMPVGMAIFDREGRFIWLNAKLAEYNGLSIDEHLGRSVTEIVGEAAEPQMQAIARIAESGEPESMEIRAAVAPDARVERFWSLDLAPVFGDSGEVCAVNATVHDISERRRGDEALARQSRRLEIAIDASGAGVYDRPEPLDGTGYYSERFLELLGLSNLHTKISAADTPDALDMATVEKAVAEFFDRIHPDDIDKLLAARQALNAGDESIMATEFRVRRPDGSYRHVRALSERVEPAREGEPVRMMGFVVDISEQRQMEAALRDSEARYRSMVERSPVAQVVYANDGDVQIVNEAWTRLTGYSHDDMPTTQRWIDLAYAHDPQQRARVEELVKKSHHSDEMNHGEVTIRTASGDIRAMEFTNGPVGTLPDGRKLRSTVLVDVTDQRALEEALRQSEARYRRIVELSPVAMAIFDSRGDFLILNDEWTRLTGYSRDELGTLDDWIRLAYGHSPENRAKLASMTREILENGETRTGEVSIQRKDGELREVGFTSGSLGKLADGRHLRSSVLVDITRHREIEGELRQAKTAAERASRAKSEFLAHVSHEIRTPMAVILGYTDILRQALTEPWQREPLRAIQRNGEHLVEVIDDILDLSRIEAGRLVLEMRHFEVLRLMRDVLTLLGRRATEKGVELAVGIEGRVPEQIETDPTRLRQILVNLIGNAIKFTGAGGHVDVAIRWDDEAAQLAFEIRDDGCGIDEDERDHIFEPFARADGSGNTEGVGLGLTITRRLVRMLGGTVRLESSPQGSVFTFTVDPGDIGGAVWLDPTEPLTLRPRMETPFMGLPSLSGRILLADDEVTLREMVARRLREAGASVVEAGDGEQALARFGAEGPFDAVLLDMKMPVRDGYSTARALRARGYTGLLVAVTAHAMKGVREDCLAAGCDAFVTKPVDFIALCELLTPHAAGSAELAGGPADPGVDSPPKEAKEANLANAAKASSPADEEQPAGGPLVLVVDDDPDAGRMLSMFLRRSGYEVMLARDGHSALSSPAATRAAVVITDIQLPDLRGHEVARRLRALNPHCRIIGYSGHPADADAEIFDDYLMKPVDPRVLLAAVEGTVEPG